MIPMRRCVLTSAMVVCLGVVVSAQADNPKRPDARAATPPDAVSEGTVTVGGMPIEYRAVAGTLTVGATDSQDATLGFDGQVLPDAAEKAPDPAKPEEAPATARMFY